MLELYVRRALTREYNLALRQWDGVVRQQNLVVRRPNLVALELNPVVRRPNLVVLQRSSKSLGKAGCRGGGGWGGGGTILFGESYNVCALVGTVAVING